MLNFEKFLSMLHFEKLESKDLLDFRFKSQHFKRHNEFVEITRALNLYQNLKS